MRCNLFPSASGVKNHIIMASFFCSFNHLQEVLEPVTSNNEMDLNLPTFWETDPELWFHVAEAKFALMGVTGDLNRCSHVIAALNRNAAHRIRHLLLKKMSDELRYDTLKKSLLDSFGLTLRERMDKLLSLNGLGDRTPSEHLAYMRYLYNAPEDDPLFMHLFLKQLPASVRSQLLTCTCSRVSELAKLADHIMETNPDIGYACLSNKSSLLSRMLEMESIPRSTTVCYYHRSFGNNARKCRSPCTWRSNQQHQEQSDELFTNVPSWSSV